MNPNSIFSDTELAVEIADFLAGISHNKSNSTCAKPLVFENMQDLLDFLNGDKNAECFTSIHPIKNDEKENEKMTQKKFSGVINLSTLTPNTRYDQMIAQNGMKVLHPDEQTAIAEAERLASANPGQEFGVFTLTAISSVQKAVTKRI